MTKIQSFRDRLVWQKAMTLAERCSRYSKRFGRDDQLVLGFEIRKSCVSIPSNIAEGFGRHYSPAHQPPLDRGSNNEPQTQVELEERVDQRT